MDWEMVWAFVLIICLVFGLIMLAHVIYWPEVRGIYIETRVTDMDNGFNDGFMYHAVKQDIQFAADRYLFKSTDIDKVMEVYERIIAADTVFNRRE